MVNTAHTHGCVKSSPKRGFSLGVNSSPCIPRKKTHDPAEGSFVGGEECDDDWLKLMSSAVVDD
eukprot:scaffold6791_cov89-Skeletonema_dohrnii-CCMP3373.AAC.1